MLNWPAMGVGVHKSITKILSPSSVLLQIYNIMYMGRVAYTAGSLLNVNEGGGCRLMLLLFFKSENLHCSMVKKLTFSFLSSLSTRAAHCAHLKGIKPGKSYQLYSKSDDGSALQRTKTSEVYLI